MDPSENSVTPGKTADYKLEIPISNGCPHDKLTNQYNDDRFKKVDGFQISEYDLYLYNGIVGKLQSLPGYEQKSLDKKKNTFYQMYVRPTVFWNLTCELREDNPITRKEAAAIFGNTGTSMKVPILMVVQASIFGFVVLITIIVILVGVSKTTDVGLHTAFMTSLFRFFILALVAVFTFLLFQYGEEAALEEKKNADNLLLLSECSDEDTQFNGDDLIKMYANAHKWS